MTKGGWRFSAGASDLLQRLLEEHYRRADPKSRVASCFTRWLRPVEGEIVPAVVQSRWRTHSDSIAPQSFIRGSGPPKCWCGGAAPATGNERSCSRMRNAGSYNAARAWRDMSRTQALHG